MTLGDFISSLSDIQPPAGIGHALAALWWAGRGDWDRAHQIVMNGDGKDSAWIHAYLHRVEGDLDNARYWYRQAGKPEATKSLQIEWEAIAKYRLSAEDDSQDHNS